MAGDLGLDVLSEEMVMENVPQFPVTGPYHGHDGVRAWWRDLTEAFEEVRIEFDEVVELDGERVLTSQRLIGRFRSTGIDADERWAAAHWVRDGKIVRTAGFASRRAALGALGAPGS